MRRYRECASSAGVSVLIRPTSSPTPDSSAGVAIASLHHHQSRATLVHVTWNHTACCSVHHPQQNSCNGWMVPTYFPNLNASLGRTSSRQAAIGRIAADAIPHSRSNLTHFERVDLHVTLDIFPPSSVIEVCRRVPRQRQQSLVKRWISIYCVQRCSAVHTQ